MLFERNLSYVAIVLIAIFALTTAQNDAEIVEETQTEPLSDGSEPSFLIDTEAPAESSDNSTNSWVSDSLTTPSTTTAVPSNATTKPTWIQRIPKRKPKPAGE